MAQIQAHEIKAGQQFTVAGNDYTATHDAEQFTETTPHMGVRHFAAIRTTRSASVFMGGKYVVEVLADTPVAVAN